MKFNNRFYTNLIGIFAIHSSVWGMEKWMNQSGIFTGSIIQPNISSSRSDICKTLKSTIHTIKKSNKEQFITDLSSLQTKKNIFKNRQIDNLINTIQNTQNFNKNTIHAIKTDLNEICEKSQTAFGNIAKRLPSELDSLVINQKKSPKLIDDIIKNIDLMIDFMTMQKSSARITKLNDIRNNILSIAKIPETQYLPEDIKAWKTTILAASVISLEPHKNITETSAINLALKEEEIEKNPEAILFPAQKTLPLKRYRSQSVTSKEKQSISPELELKLQQELKKQQEQNQLEQKLEGLKEELNQLESSLFKTYLSGSLPKTDIFELLTNKIKELDDLYQKYQTEKIFSLLMKYKNTLTNEAYRFTINIIEKSLSLEDKLTLINQIFPANNDILKPYRTNALQNLTSKTVHELNTKNITSEGFDKELAIKKIFFLANKIEYLIDNDKTLFNKKNEHLHSLFAESSYPLLRDAITTQEEKEHFKTAWELIKQAVNYKKPISQTIMEQPSQSTTSTSIQQQPSGQSTATTTTQPTITEQKKEDEILRQKEAEQKQHEEGQLELKRLQEEVKRLEQIKSQGWILWIKESITNFFNSITSTLTSWLSWFIGK